MLKLVLKSNPDTELTLSEGRHTIGRDPNNDLVLNDESVSGFHAQIIVEGDSIGLVDLGSKNGTAVDGRSITGRQAIKPWQSVRFGALEAECVDPDGRRPTSVMRSIRDEDIAQATAAKAGSGEAPAQAPSLAPSGPVRAYLKRSGSSEYPNEVELRDRLEIGREDDSDLSLHSDMVSTRHARIEWQRNHFVVTDLGSTNGTRVNGEPVKSKPLATGDRVAFDEIEYRFEQVGEPERKTTTVNPAIHTERKGTRVRPAVDSSQRQETPRPASNRSHASNRDAKPDADPTRPIPSVESKPESEPLDQAATRVQPAVRRPVQRPQKSRPPTPRPRSNTPPQSKPAVAASRTPLASEPVRAQPPGKQETPPPQQVIVKQKGNGCLTAMVFVILLIIAFPLLVFVFKVGFLVAIFNQIRSFLGL